MDNGLKNFLDEIFNDIGVMVEIVGNDFEVNGKQVFLENQAKKAEKYILDVENDATIFCFKFKNKKYIGKIKGSSKVEKNYAYLISELAEKTNFNTANLTKEDFYRGLLFGELTAVQVSKHIKKFLLKDQPACVLAVYNEKGKIKDILNVIKNYSNSKLDFSVIIDENQCFFVKFSDEQAGDYQSITEYAEFLSQTIYEETGELPRISVGGKVQSIADLSTSQTQATFAQQMAIGVNSCSKVHTYKEYVFIKMLEDLPKQKLKEYLNVLVDFSAKELFDDEEMINTADEFLENSLNISETSRKLYLHRNTLTYRLDKIEKITGLDIRKFSDALTFRLISILSKILG